MGVKSFLLLTAAAIVPQAAVSQDVIELDEAFVFSGLVPVEINRTGSTVEIVDADDLAASEVSVENTLDRLPGVSVTSNGGLGTASTVRVRGLDGKYIGVTIDGIEVTDPSSTQTSLNFGSFTRGLVDRIELAKGSQTTVYGSDAIAGAINISTWRPDVDGRSGQAAVEAGSFGTFSTALSFGYRDGDGEVAATISRAQTDGFSALADVDASDADSFQETGLSLSIRRNLSDAVTVGATGFLTNSVGEFDSPFGVDKNVGQTDLTRTGARVFAEISAGAIDHEVGLSYFENDRFFPFTTSTESFIGERVKLDYLGTTDIGAKTTLAFGADWTEETSTLDGVASEASNGAVFGELVYALSDATDVTLGLRHDVFSDFDDQTSGRLAFVHRAAGALTYKASIGNGYRAPSLFERFSDFSPEVVPLQPETSQGFDVGIEADYENASYGATVFYTEIEDLIGFDPTAVTVARPFGAYFQAPGTTVSKGIELAADWSLGGADVFASYTYTNAENDFGRLSRVPRHDLTLGVAGALSDTLTAGVDVRSVNDTVNGGSALDDYTVANLTLTQSLGDDRDVYLRVENIFDEDYETVPGYNTAGLSVFVGLRASF
ncbi:MAG: TonB-dependent receptor [Boseongicola sp.]|nr:TonB-dependent receptor [Boseongicola sp.]